MDGQHQPAVPLQEAQPARTKMELKRERVNLLCESGRLRVILGCRENHRICISGELFSTISGWKNRSKCVGKYQFEV